MDTLGGDQDRLDPTSEAVLEHGEIPLLDLFPQLQVQLSPLHLLMAGGEARVY